MRVAILTPSFLPAYNGMTFASLQHASMLSGLGHEVAIVASCLREQIESNTSYLAERGAAFLPMDISGSGLPSRPVVGDIRSVVESIVSFAPRVVLVEGRYFWGYHLIPYFRHRGLSIALVSHGSAATGFDWTFSWAVKSIAYGIYNVSHERRILGAIDAVAVLSAHEDDERFRDARVYRRLGLSPLVVGNTSIERVAREVRRTFGERGKLRIALVGEMSTTKNQLAAIGLAEDNPAVSFIRFYFPSETAYSKRVASLAEKRGVANLQYRTGLDREAIMRSLGDIDLMLCLSTTEAQPLSIVDGLACGVPFLSTPVGCMPSMKGGLVSSIPGMRGILRRLAADATAMDGLAGEAKDYFESTHSESVVKPALTALISAAIVGRGRPGVT